MNAVTCPKCGGTQNRPLAPGFYECMNEVIVDVIPPGMRGNPAPIPVPGICGNRFQAGGPGTAVDRCWCQMFAVGTCHTCGQALCGDHGGRDGSGYFVCNHHIAEARAHAAEEAQLHAQQELQEAKAAVEAEEKALKDLVPEFPGDPARGPALATALHKLVPARKERFEHGRKSFGRVNYVEGWGFVLERRPDLGKPGRHHCDFMIVTTDGRLLRFTGRSIGIPDWRPTMLPPNSLEIDQQPAVEGRNRRTILDQVVIWLGLTSVPVEPTPKQRYLVEFEDSLTRPSYEVWISKQGGNG